MLLCRVLIILTQVTPVTLAIYIVQLEIYMLLVYNSKANKIKFFTTPE